MNIAPDYRAATAFVDFAGPDFAPFGDIVAPADFPKAVLRYRNQRWAAAVGLGGLTDEQWIDHFARFSPLPDNLAQPVALRYHGHQFRSYNSEIGDGRGFLYAQLYDGAGRLLDLGTKGSGQTPYSRFGDGRLTLKGGVREILATELLEALGVYTSKSFSLIETGEELERQDEPSPTRSAVLVRLGHSHIRFGAFQRLAAEQNTDALAQLVEYCVAQFDPDLATLPTDEKTLAFFKRVMARTARMVSQWMAAGFVHGVLNTDNMNVTGESFDYGPWRFLPTMDPNFTAAYFDQTGLYAYARQGEAAIWNLSRFGGALVTLTAEAGLNDALKLFPDMFETAMADAFFARLGLARGDAKDDFVLIFDLMRWMNAAEAPFEQVMFDWFCADETRAARSPISDLYAAPEFAEMAGRLKEREAVDAKRLKATYFQAEKPQSMLIEEVEALWAPIAEADDWSAFERKLLAINDARQAYGLAR